MIYQRWGVISQTREWKDKMILTEILAYYNIINSVMKRLKQHTTARSCNHLNKDVAYGVKRNWNGEGVLQAQVSNRMCKTAAQTVRSPALFTYYGDDGLVSQVLLHGALQKYLLVASRDHILYVFHNPSSRGHPRERWMFDQMRHHCVWRHMANENQKSKKLPLIRPRWTPSKAEM